MAQVAPKAGATDNVCFRSDEWLRAFTGGMLVREAVLDYFTLSPFYDRNCINEIARAQNLRTSQINAPGPFEYVLHPKEVPPHLFVVCKQQRVPPDTLKTLATYYVLDGTIYPAPLLHDGILSTRTTQCMYGVRMAFKALSDVHGTGAQAAQSKGLGEGDGEPNAAAKRERPHAKGEEQFLDHAIWTALNSAEEYVKENKLGISSHEVDKAAREVKPEGASELGPEQPRPAKQIKQES